MLTGSKKAKEALENKNIPSEWNLHQKSTGLEPAGSKAICGRQSVHHYKPQTGCRNALVSEYNSKKSDGTSDGIEAILGTYEYKCTLTFFKAVWFVMDCDLELYLKQIVNWAKWAIFFKIQISQTIRKWCTTEKFSQPQAKSC